ncbi:hypothetical protein GCM10027072_32490 [Streptomyces bullii]
MPRRGRFRRGAAALTLVALSGGGLLTAAPAATAADPAAPAGTACTPTEGFEGCRLFVPTGGAQDFQVPSRVTELNVRVWGEGGTGNSMASGGAGGFVAGTLGVTAGEKLRINVGGPRFGDARGGKGGTTTADRGGNSSGIRTGTGKPLVIAGGGGGGGGDWTAHAQAGAAGGVNGSDASEPGRGGKGATGAKGGAGAGNGAAGADHSAGGAGGDGGDGSNGGGGGGGAGYAGGGGGTGSDTVSSKGTTGSGGGGSSYTDPDRVTEARLVVGNGTKPPEKTDPFWAPSGDPVNSGVAEGGANAPGGPGRIVLQWDTAAIADLTQVSGADQVVHSFGEVAPFGVEARDKDGDPVANASVTYTIEDPDGLGVYFGDREDRKAVVATDARGRAVSPAVWGSKDGRFTVRAAVGGASTTFTVEVREAEYEVTVAEGDGQVAAPGADFSDDLRVLVTDAGTPAQGATVTFEVFDFTDGSPRFEGGDRVVRVKTDDEGLATAPRLTAGDTEGSYEVYATTGDAEAAFHLKVASEPDDATPSGEPTASAEPSPSDSAGTGGSTGDGSGGGTSTDLGGSLASTGAGGAGLLMAVAAALAAAGLAAVRFGPRLKARRGTHG